MTGMDSTNSNQQHVDQVASDSSREHATQQMVVPVRTVRKGQIDWVSPISNEKEFKTWEFEFRKGASIYLSKEVYPDQKERSDAWQMALLRAANLGHFAELKYLLQIYDADGLQCEDLLGELKRQFLPSVDAEKQRVMLLLKGFSRGKKSLLEAVKELKIIVLECHKNGFKPDKDLLKLTYESLLPPNELPTLRLYELKVVADRKAVDPDALIPPPFTVFMNAIEQLAMDQEVRKTDGVGAIPPFAGGAVGEGKNRGGGKKKPKRKGFKGDAKAENKKCSYCGHGNCPALKGEGKERCPAFGQTCQKCGKKGHFKSVCRAKDASSSGPQASAALVGLECF